MRAEQRITCQPDKLFDQGAFRSSEGTIGREKLIVQELEKEVPLSSTVRPYTVSGLIVARHSI
jgi:hypothetical protein